MKIVNVIFGDPEPRKSSLSVPYNEDGYIFTKPWARQSQVEVHVGKLSDSQSHNVINSMKNTYRDSTVHNPIYERKEDE